MHEVNFASLNEVQRRTPGAVRCTAHGWTSEGRMPELAARQSAQVQAVLARQAWARRLRSSDSSAMSSGAGSGPTCFANKSPVACSSLPFATASRNSTSLRAPKRCHPVVHAWFFSQRSVTARDAHPAEDWRRRALFITMSSNEPSKTARASVALACVWMQRLKLRKTTTPQGCKYDGMKHCTMPSGAAGARSVSGGRQCSG